MTMIFVLIVKTDKFYVRFMRNENNIFLSKLKNVSFICYKFHDPTFCSPGPPYSSEGVFVMPARKMLM